MMQIQYRSNLPALMQRLNLPMVAVELGVAEGNFSEDLLRLGIEKLYSVDVWQTIKNQKGDASQSQEWHDKNYSHALLRLMEYGDKSVILKGMSVEMASKVLDDSLGLVYLDGDHSYNGVMADLNAWFPKLVKGGIMAGHDYLMEEYGIFKAVAEFTQNNDAHVSKIYITIENEKKDAGFYFFKK